MFLALLLLDFQGETGSENTLRVGRQDTTVSGVINNNTLSIFECFTYSWQRKEGNSKHTEARGYYFPHPRLRHRVTVTDSRDCYNAPPQCVRVAGKVVALQPVLADGVLLRQVHEIRAEDQSQETDVQRRD